MGLLKKFLGGRPDDGKAGGVSSSQFHESETTAHPTSSANAPRRELVQVVLRDTMRKLAVPSDWIECRILSVVTRKHQTGMHVQFIVRRGEDKLLPYVRTFQDMFWSELEKFEARPRSWLFSLAWQFEGERESAAPPLPQGWGENTRPPDDEQDTQPPEEDAAELESDLQALFAIRDAELSRSADLEEPPRRNPPRS